MFCSRDRLKLNCCTFPSVAQYEPHPVVKHQSSKDESSVCLQPLKKIICCARKHVDRHVWMFCFHFKHFYIYCLILSIALWFFFLFFFFCLFALEFSKNRAVCVARQLQQANYVNSLCVGNVVDVEMLDMSCALQSVAFHTGSSRLINVKTLFL